MNSSSMVQRRKDNSFDDVKLTIPLNDLWEKFHSKEIGLKSFIELMGERLIVSSKYMIPLGIELEQAWYFIDLVYGTCNIGLIDQHTKQALPQNEAEFNEVWEELCNWAVINKVFLEAESVALMEG